MDLKRHSNRIKSFVEDLKEISKASGYPDLILFTNHFISFLNEDYGRLMMMEFDRVWEQQTTQFMMDLDRHNDFDRESEDELYRRTHEIVHEEVRKTYDALPRSTRNMTVDDATFNKVLEVIRAAKFDYADEISRAKIKMDNEDAMQNTFVYSILYSFITFSTEQLNDQATIVEGTSEGFKKRMIQHQQRTQSVNKEATKRATVAKNVVSSSFFLD